jgi:hypothetical protein
VAEKPSIRYDLSLEDLLEAAKRVENIKDPRLRVERLFQELKAIAKEQKTSGGGR